MRIRTGHYLIMFLIPVVFFLLLDGILRVAGIDPYQKERLSPQFACKVKKRYQKGVLANGQKAYIKTIPWDTPFQFQPIPAHKAENTVYIFVLGGSAPSGFPFSGRFAFSQWLKAGLERVYPELSFHLVNASLPGASLNTISTVVKEMLDYQPDVIIIYSGNNEHYGMRKKASGEKNRNRAPVLLRIFWKLRSFQVLHYLIVGKQPAFDWEFAIADSEKKKTVLSGDSLPYLLGNAKTALQTIHQMASGANVPLLFCTVPVNEKDWPPYQSRHLKPLPQSEQEIWAQNLRKAADLIQHQRPEEARRICENLLQQDQRYAMVHFLLGKTFEQTGQYMKARKAFLTALDEDTMRLRAGNALNRTIAGFCGRHSIPVADCVERLRRSSAHGLLGYEQFLDNCHLKPSAHRTISREIACTLLKTGIFPKPPVNWKYKFEKGLTRYAEVTTIPGKEYAFACLHTAKALLEGLTFRMDLEALHRAEKYLHLALKEYPEICSGHFYLGVIYFLSGKTEQARLEWKTELKNCPRFSAARATLDLLEKGRLSSNILLQKKIFNLVVPQF